MYDLRAGLGVWEPQDAVRGVHVLPLESHDLVQAAAREDQQAHRQDRGGQLDALALHLPQNLAHTAQFGGAEEALALLLGVLLDVLARVRAVRAQAPHLGEAEHLGDDLQAPVGLVGDVTKVVVELGDVGAGDPTIGGAGKSDGGIG